MNLSHIIAAERMDWGDIPEAPKAPCFHVGNGGEFCALPVEFHPQNMADRHPFTSLADMLRKVTTEAAGHLPIDMNDQASALLDIHSGACSVPEYSPLGLAFRELEQAGFVTVSHNSMSGMIEIHRK